MGQMIVSQQPVLIRGTGAETAILSNLDTTDIIYFGPNPTVTTLDAQLAPLSNITVSGGMVLYASTLSSATAKLMVIPQGVMISPPAFVGNVQSFSAVQEDETASPYNFHTFGADGRIWNAHLSLAVMANTS